VRGRGLLAAVEFVADKDSRAPLPRKAKFAETFAEAALEAGLVTWPSIGNADGTNGDLSLLAPPFIITEDQITELIERFTAALEAAAKRALGAVIHPEVIR